MSSPQGNRVSLPARAAYSHSASLGSRYRFPVISDSQPAYACASSQDTSIAGRSPRPNPRSRTPLRQAPAAAHASHCANVVSYLASAKGRGMLTVRTGPSSTSPPPDRSPIRKVPAGTTTSSGHTSQSRMTAPGTA